MGKGKREGMEEKRRNVGRYFSFVLTASVSRVREIGSAPLGGGGGGRALYGRGPGYLRYLADWFDAYIGPRPAVGRDR